MKKLSIVAVLLVSLLVLFTVSGCIFDSPSDAEKKEDAPTAPIDQEFGGFNTSDESEAFGDNIIATEFEDDESESDLLDSDPSLETDLNNPKIDVYFLRITWGLLEGDSTATEVVDWSGKAEINKSTLTIMKKVRFELNDKIVRPRADRRTVEWISQTKPHFDGICLTIIDNDTAKSDVAGVLNLTIGAYTKTFSFTELDSMNLLEPVGANGHEVSIISRKKAVVPFAGGFLEGKWVRKDSAGGVFYGKWINSLGTRVGHLRGIWGTNRFGHHVLYGKWIDLRGRFQGLLAGTWGHSAESKNKGWIEGRWVNRSLTTAGHFEARWKTADDSKNKGFFHGKWRRR